MHLDYRRYKCYDRNRELEVGNCETAPSSVHKAYGRLKPTNTPRTHNEV